ncbi:hypothetical protein BGZ95_003871 [Linnemannia exigua]|uniref:HCP-like protein n=1 Tax=Linnemannia exigua TaxID=604196 RepID=A0AAD4D458_9FUNG|nr:hypothetical protein BGZ95_003871 [Linnemannia exigua]
MSNQETLPHVQAVRRVLENEHPSSTTSGIIHLVSHPDASSGKDILLRDDILAAFKEDVIHVRSGTVILPFLKGPDFKNLEPLRIATVPGATLDVIVRSQSGDNKLSLKSQETALPDVPPEYNASSATRSGTNNSDKNARMSYDGDLHSQSPPEYSSSSSSHDFAGTEMNAKLGDKDAQVALGDMYRGGKGVQKDYQAAMAWYLKAADQGDSQGQSKVGLLYRDGLGVKQNHATAIKWYLKAAEQGDVIAQCNIAYSYEEGDGVEQDYSQARDWYLRAANQGYALGQCNLGYLYEHGQGVSKNYALAMELYLKAAEQGHGAAQLNIGNMYQSGRGVPADYSKAMEWYLKSADQGKAQAQYRIGMFYKEGLGVAKDDAKAMEWFKKAADQRYAKAKEQLDILESERSNGGKVEKKRGLLRKMFK